MCIALPVQAGPPGSLVIVGRPVEPPTLDPAQLDDADTASILANIFEPLVTVRPDGTVAGLLAERWEAERGGRSWLFTLRERVYFQDGTAMTAAAVKFSFDRQRNRRFRTWGAVFGEDLHALVKNVAVLSPRHVRFELTRPCFTLLYQLARPQFSVVSPVAANSDHFGRRPVGTGPFGVVEWLEGERLVLTEHKQYWRGVPATERVVYDFLSTDQSRARHLMARRVDVLAGLLGTDLADFKMGNARPSLIRTSGFFLTYMRVNVRRKPWNELSARRALNYAVHRERLVPLFASCSGLAADSPLTPELWGYEPQTMYVPNLDKARRDLRRAQRGRRTPSVLLYSVTPTPSLPFPDAVARRVKDDLENAGLEVQLDGVPRPLYQQRLEAADFDLAICQYAAPGHDPDSMLWPLWSRGSRLNYGFYSNDRVQEALERARISPHSERRLAYWRRAQRLLSEDAALVPLAYSAEWIATMGNVMDLDPLRTGMLDLRRARRVEE